MSYEEYKKAVYEECLKDATAKAHPEEFEKVFKEEEEAIKKDFENNHPIADTAWGICLLI